MDPILAGITILIFAVFIPAVLSTLTIKVYLFALSLVVLVSFCYVWLLEQSAPSPSVSRLQAKLGLFQVYPPVQDPAIPGDDPAADEICTTVVFVHGLGANPAKTWTAEDDKTSCSWIKDLFPGDLQTHGLQSTVRLAMFHYNSFWVRNCNLRLRDTALSLLQGLEILKGRIIMVGHSFGGIIIKKALVMSPELRGRLQGLVFLGTPHQGTSFNRYGVLTSYLLAPLDPDIEIMRILAPDSVVLEDLQREFERYSTGMNRKYFFEGAKTERRILGSVPWIREYVVTKRSATHGANEMDIIALDTDHRGLNKFPGRNSNYHLVTRVLLNMMPRTRVIAASDFSCLDVDQRDADYPGRLLWYRENVGANGYPEGVRVEPEYAVRTVRPIGDVILTCRRQNIPKSHQPLYRGFTPNSQQPPENSVCERFFPSTTAGNVTPDRDSGFFFPWDLHCSVGRPQNYDEFLHADIFPRDHPLAAPVLLRAGYSDKQFEEGYWRTLKNTGWCEVKGLTYRVGDDKEMGLVIGNRFVPEWIGGFSFGGVKLEPIG